MATAKKNVKRDDPTGTGRFGDQPGQIRNTTPASVRASQKKAWDDYVAKYGDKPAKKSGK